MSDEGPRVFSSAEYPEGMRCSDCRRAFIDGQPIEDRLTAMDTCDSLADVFGGARTDPLYWTEPVCHACAIGATA